MADIYVRCKDTQVIPQPVENVLVRVFDETGATFITSQSTDVDGLAEFNLSLATTYRIKMSMSTSGYSIESPQTITTVAEDDVFDISVELHTVPVATDPFMCRASGYLYRPDASGAEGVIIIFAPVLNPVLVLPDPYPTVVMAMQKVRAVADEDGYTVIDLVRGATYGVVMAGLEYSPTQITIPDRSWVNIGDLLFPYPLSVVFDPVSASIAVGETVEITPTITLRSGIELTLDEIDRNNLVLDFESAPEDGITVMTGGETIQITGVTAGSYVVTMSVSACSTFVYPEVTFSGSITITVS